MVLSIDKILNLFPENFYILLCSEIVYFVNNSVHCAFSHQVYKHMEYFNETELSFTQHGIFFYEFVKTK
jgi:hypothetical protein